MDEKVKALVFDALHKGRVMRECQREYFKTRTESALRLSKNAENEFDTALDTAAKAVKRGYVIEQEELL